MKRIVLTLKLLKCPLNRRRFTADAMSGFRQEWSRREVRTVLIVWGLMFLGTVAYATQNVESARNPTMNDHDAAVDGGMKDETDTGDSQIEETQPSDLNQPTFSPPKIVQYIEADYPTAALDAGILTGAEVVAELEIDTSGLVIGVVIKTPAGHGFDEAATHALYHFIFTPATRNGTPISAKVLFRYKFAPYDVPLAETAVSKDTNPPPHEAAPEAISISDTNATPSVKGDISDPSNEQDIIDAPSKTDAHVDDEIFETVITGQRRAESKAAAHFEMKVGKLRVVPRKDVTEQLMMAPGVLTTNHGGDGHAHETYMRGFASKEGQDVEFLVDGIPLNEVGNPHNHGYADLYFIPPEVVESVTVTEGAFDPEQGDFSFAGTAEYRLNVERGTQVSYGLGMWNTHRTFGLIAPEKANGTFAGFEYYTTDGYGKNRSAKRALGLGRFSGELEKKHVKYGLTVFGYAARFDQPGVVRQDDYESKDMGFYDTYDANQGGESNRFLASLDLSIGPSDANFKQVAFFGWRTMRLRTNFTGWLTDSTLDEAGNLSASQRGDGLEMRYNVITGGSRGRYLLSRQLLGQEQNISIGYAFRMDHGDAEQLRLRSVTAIPYRQVFDNEFSVFNIAGWVRTQFRPVKRLTLRGGLRLDTFSFGITDNNQPEADREGERVPSQTSQSFGFALNPRMTVDVLLLKGLHALASYGQGTRSTDAAALSDNETAPFARAQEVDAGFAYQYGKQNDPVQLSAQTGYSMTKVNKDLIFSETEGRNVLAGASTRHAVLFSGRIQLFSLVDLLANVGWTHATLDETGELMPYIPRLVARLDAAVSGQISDWKLGSVPVTGQVGLGFTYVPGRPLPFKERGDSMYLLGSGGDVRLWQFSIGVEMRNLLNRQYRQAEFNYASNFEAADAIPSQLPERHFVAGEPFYIMGTVTWHIEEMIHSFKARP